MVKYAHIRATVFGNKSELLVKESAYKEATEEEGMGPEVFFPPNAENVRLVQWVDILGDHEHRLPDQFGVY